MIEARKPFDSLGYEPVGPIVNKLLARYLRTQRKNMKRFFEERGLHTLADRMKQIRRSRQGMMAKNLMFQQVLNDYAKLATLTSLPGGATTPGVPEGAGEPPTNLGADEAAHPQDS